MGEGSDVLASAAMTGNPYIAMGEMALKSAQGGSAGPSTATSNAKSGFDSSGWNVSFGAGDISATTAKSSTDEVGAAMGGNYAPYAFLLIGAVVLWKMVKKS